MIQSALAETKWVAAMQLIIAKVPILRLRFNEPFTDITVDLNANNSVAIRNTHLLCYYSSCVFYFSLFRKTFAKIVNRLYVRLLYLRNQLNQYEPIWRNGSLV